MSYQHGVPDDQQPQRSSALDEGYGRSILQSLSPGGYFGDRSGAAKALLALLYPFWLVIGGLVAFFWYAAYFVFWLLFSPIRVYARWKRIGWYAPGGPRDPDSGKQ